ncbi:MAG: lipocalin family protein [Thermodesulfobacteriota bacterium]
MNQTINRRVQWAPLVLYLALALFTSGASALAAAEISHTAPEGNYIPGFRINLDAAIQSDGGLLTARCYFKTKNDQNFAFVDMFDKGNGNYQAVLPAPWVNSEAVEYLFVAVDKDKKVARSQVYTLEEGQTEEAAQWKDASQVKEVRLDTMQEGIEDCELLRRQLRTNHGRKLPEFQTADEANPLTVQTEMNTAEVPMNGFYDRAVITEVADSAKYGAAAIGATAGWSTAAIVGTGVAAAAVVGGTAVALSGGGGGGGGNKQPEDLTERTITGPWSVTGNSIYDWTTSGDMNFNDNGSFTYNLHSILPDNSTTDSVGNGQWTLVGTTLTLNFDGGAVYNGTASGDSDAFTMVDNNIGWTLYFSR